MSLEFQNKKILIADESRSFIAWANQFCNQHILDMIELSQLDEIETQVQHHSPDFILINGSFAIDNEEDFIQKTTKLKIISSTPLLIYSDMLSEESFLRLSLNGVDVISSQSFMTKNFVAMLHLLIRKRGDAHYQLENAKKMLGVYKHELGNILTILFGKQMKLEMVHPELISDPSFESIKKTLHRLDEVTNKINTLRNSLEISEHPVGQSMEKVEMANE